MLAVSFLAMPQETRAQAAGLFLAPATGIYPIGEPFSIEVRVDTSDVAVGTADAVIAYAPEDIEFVSYSAEGSIFSSIITEPDQRTPGRIRISGIMARNKSAYTGPDGLFVVLTFRALRNISTEVRFAQGSATPLLAAVGAVASNVLSGLGAATYTLIPKETIPPVAAVVYAAEDGVPPGGIEITPVPVPEHGWLATTSVKLTWSLPKEVTEMRTHVSDNPVDVPTKVYAVPVSSVDLTGLAPGTNYFHLQMKTNDTWGPVTHFPLKVDLTPPDYVVITEAERDSSDPKVAFLVEAADAPSGIGRYEVALDDAEAEPWTRPEDGKYRPDGLEPGEHTLIVTAFDNAGNSTSSTHAFTLRAIEPPVLTDVPDKVLTGNRITVRGTTQPDSDVTVFISYNDGEAAERKVRSDGSGAFTADITEAARSGKYTVWFQVTDSRGATSPLSIKRSVDVSQPFIMLFGSIAVTYLSVIVPLIALILLLVLVVWLGYAWQRSYRSRIKRETGEAYGIVRGEFADLRNELVKQIGMLERANQSRELTREEMRIFKDLSQRLEEMEAHISEEIDDIVPVENAWQRTQTPVTPQKIHGRRAEVAAPAAHTLKIERR